MNNKHIWIIVWMLLSTKIFAQVGQNPPPNMCNDVVRTTTPTINVWDWRTPTWEVYIAGYFNPPVNVITSPFYEVNNFNTYGLAQFEVKDYDPNEGWELIKRDIGTPQIRTPAPYWVFYNKYTARLRGYFLILKNDRGEFSIDPDKGAFIRVRFTTELNTYQSNLLTLQNNEQYPFQMLEAENRKLKALEKRIQALEANKR